MSLIPQSITDDFIAIVNISPAQYWFTEKIDLANGSIGVDMLGWSDGELDNQDKIQFATIFWKTLWITDINIYNPENIWINAPVIVSEINFPQVLNNSWILWIAWWASQMIKNFKEIQDGSTNEKVKNDEKKQKLKSGYKKPFRHK